MSIVYRYASRKVYLYLWDKTKKKQVQISRSFTKDWDNLSEVEVNRKLEEFIKSNQDKYALIKRRLILEDSPALSYFNMYLEHKQSLTDNRSRTYRNEHSYFTNYILVYFIEECGLQYPMEWHPKVPDFVSFLKKKKLKTRTILKIAGVLKRFGEYLVYTRRMTFPFTILLPKSKKDKITPLKHRITPTEIFLAVSKIKEDDLKLLLLVSYFASLGPGESLALSKESFLTGESARKLTKTYEGLRQAGLGSSLSIVIEKSIQGDGKLVPLVKNDYRYGVVNIFNAEAAKQIATLLKQHQTDKLFSYSSDYMQKLWLKIVKPLIGATMHDMRRASLLYLGRTIRIPPTLLQEHARHAELDTTMLYCRDPQLPEVDSNRIQDFDDVS